MQMFISIHKDYLENVIQSCAQSKNFTNFEVVGLYKKRAKSSLKRCYNDVYERFGLIQKDDSEWFFQISLFPVTFK